MVFGRLSLKDRAGDLSEQDIRVALLEEISFAQVLR
jgi:hypothetical protein